MELLLDVEELLDITTSTSPEPKKRESNEWNEWRKLDKRARLEIILNVDVQNSQKLFENSLLQLRCGQN